VLDPLRIGQNIQEILESDLAAEYDARNSTARRRLLRQHRRPGVQEPVRGADGDEEGHIDFLETQINLVEQIGIELYAQKHIGGLGKDEADG
jgi:bacterioferritin